LPCGQIHVYCTGPRKIRKTVIMFNFSPYTHPYCKNLCTQKQGTTLIYITDKSNSQVTSSSMLQCYWCEVSACFLYHCCLAGSLLDALALFLLRWPEFLGIFLLVLFARPRCSVSEVEVAVSLLRSAFSSSAENLVWCHMLSLHMLVRPGTIFQSSQIRKISPTPSRAPAGSAPHC
jgi:hypothetical protein